MLAQYLHACAGFPPVSTFVKAIANGNFITWPGITNIVKCFLPSTHAVRDTDIVELFLANVPFPSMTTKDLLLKSTNDILSIIKTKKLSLPGITMGDPVLKSLSDLTHMLRPTDTPSLAKLPPKPSFAPWMFGPYKWCT